MSFKKTIPIIYLVAITAVMVFMLSGCSENDNEFYAELEAEAIEKEPVACFTFNSLNSDTVRTGDILYFTNCSSNGQSYLWDFGDGTRSNENNPTHYFNKKGTYNITLKVLNSMGTDSISSTININCLYNNYIIENDKVNEIETFNILFAKYRSKNRFCIEISDNNAVFELDTITGSGFAAQLICEGNIFTSTYKLLKGSKYIPNLTYPNRISQTIDLTNAEIDIRESSGYIEVYLKNNDLEINYKGVYSLGHYYNFPTYEELENSVKKSQDPRATHSFAQYDELLTELSKDKYQPLTIWDMYNTYNDQKVIVGLRHDVDCHPFKALEMAKMENSYGINASYYILATSNYYGEFNSDSVRRNQVLNKLYLQLYNLGAEIGIHNDLLTVMISKKLDPFQFNRNEIAFYESLGIPIYGNVGHGSTIASQTVHNSQMFSDFAQSSTITYNGETYPIGSYSMLEYGFLYEANFFTFNQYYSESGGRWSIDGGFDAVMERLRNSKAGDRIQILTHPVWWGK